MHWMIGFSFLTQTAMPSTPAVRIDVPTPIEASSWTADADPADSLLRAAGKRMSRGDYRGAAELYRAAVRRFPGSMRISEAMYYQAFALYRAGDLTKARGALDVLRERYPQAATRGDANSLRARICGELARQGDSACAEEVATVSASAAARPDTRERRDAARGAARAGDCPDGDDEDDSRIAALNALLQMDADRAMPILTKVLARRDTCSERLRRKAVFLVAQKQSTESADVLLAAARNDPDSEVREQAVFWLSQVRDPRAVDMLVTILNSNGETALRDRALFALSQHVSPKAAAVLRDFAEDEHQPTELRQRAIFSLGQRREGEQMDYLRSLYRKVSSQALKENVMFALMQRRGSGNEAFIMAIVTDPKEPLELRKKAIFNVGQMGTSVTQLTTLYSTLDDRELREQVIFAIAQRHESAALDKLMDIAKSDPDRELRKKAIFWLGQSRDPRATTFLAELINK
jgi:HEAT repeat protein